MILGVSHIVLGSTDAGRDRALFESMGWQLRFEQHHLPVFAGKKPFLCTASEELSLVFLNAPAGTPLELIHYSEPSPSDLPAPLQVILPKGACSDSVVDARPSPLPGVSELCIEGLTSPLWVSEEAPRPSLIVHRVTDLAAASRFWEAGFGFRRSSLTPPVPGAMLLEFPSLMPQWRAGLLLLPVQESAPALLDGPGFRVLSMVSTQFERDRERIFEKGGAKASTGTMEEEIGGKPMLLDLIQGPDGVMVEIFQTLR
jgi:catechol 2,3-dioxygenase-like lactoylglutathione lyase family enzyme